MTKISTRLIGAFLAFVTVILLVPLTAIPVSAAKVSCSSDTCDGCDVTCTFNPKSTLDWYGFA